MKPIILRLPPPLKPQKRIRNNTERAYNEARRKRQRQQMVQATAAFDLTEASDILDTKTRSAVLQSKGITKKDYPSGRTPACYVSFTQGQHALLKQIFDAVRAIDVDTLIDLITAGALHWVHGDSEKSATNCMWMPPAQSARRPKPLPEINMLLDAFGQSANLSDDPSFILYPTAQEFDKLKRKFHTTATHFKNHVSDSQQWHCDNDYTYDTRSLTIPSEGEKFTEVSSFSPGINPARLLSRSTVNEFTEKISKQGTTWNHTKKNGEQRRGDDGKTGLLFEGRVFHRGPGPQHKNQRRIVIFGQLKRKTRLPPEPQVLTINTVYNLAKEIDGQITKSLHSFKRITSLFYTPQST